MTSSPTISEPISRTVSSMLRSYPAAIRTERELLARCITACLECAQACTACADACLSEADVDPLRTCIRADLDCADVCESTARVLSRHTGYDATVARTLLEACIQACRSCGDECLQHADMHEHCRICAEACRACELACRQLVAAL